MLEMKFELKMLVEKAMCGSLGWVDYYFGSVERSGFVGRRSTKREKKPDKKLYVYAER